MRVTGQYLESGQWMVEGGHPEGGRTGRPLKAVRSQGFTLTELMIVVALLALLATLAVPNFVRARRATQVRLCISNLSQIDSAKQQWAMENRKRDTDIPTTAAVAAYLKGTALPACPANGTYRVRRVSRNPVCSLYPLGHTLSNLNMDDDPLPD